MRRAQRIVTVDRQGVIPGGVIVVVNQGLEALHPGCNWVPMRCAGILNIAAQTEPPSSPDRNNHEGGKSSRMFLTNNFGRLQSSAQLIRVINVSVKFQATWVANKSLYPRGHVRKTPRLPRLIALVAPNEGCDVMHGFKSGVHLVLLISVTQIGRPSAKRCIHDVKKLHHDPVIGLAPFDS